MNGKCYEFTEMTCSEKHKPICSRDKEFRGIQMIDAITGNWLRSRPDDIPAKEHEDTAILFYLLIA